MKYMVAGALLVAHLSWAQDGSFEAADRYAKEESHSRACDAFTAFLKSNPSSSLQREATAKQARSCWVVGRGPTSYETLRKLSSEGEKDYARAYAAWAFAERTGNDMRPALTLLKDFAGTGGRIGAEAKALYLKASFAELDRSQYDRARTQTLVRDVLDIAPDAHSKALARLYRARAALRTDGKAAAEGVAELKELGAQSTDVADDALFELGQRYETQGDFVAALQQYDAVVSRFSPSTSNVHDNARGRAQEVRRPSASLGVAFIELAGSAPEVHLSYRNVSSARWSLKRVDPTAMTAASVYSDEEGALAAVAQSPLKTWSTPLTVSAPHAYGQLNFRLEVTEPGAYVLEVDADGQKDKELALITSHATAVRIGRDDLVTFTANALTGLGEANAEVTAYVRTAESSEYVKLTAKADTDGLARFDLQGRPIQAATVWAASGKSFSFARSYSGSWYRQPREQLGWVLTDRPLYKPGETVGIKVFLRSREEGPSTPLANESFVLSVRDASGREVGKAPLTTNTFGTASYSLTLPKDAQLGQWHCYLQATNKNYVQNGLGFRVEEYKPPEYTVSVTPLKNAAPGEPLRVKVAASFFFGGPVADAQGRALVTVRSWSHQWGRWPDEPVDENPDDGYGHGHYKRRYYDEEYYRPQLATHTLQFKTGADGTAELELPAYKPGVNGDLEYAVQVFVTDASRREVQGSGVARAAKAPFFVDLKTDRFLYKPGERVTARVRAEDANGRPVSPKLTARLVRVSETGGSTIAERSLELAAGAGSVQLDADALGQVRVEVRERADAPTLASSEVWLTNSAKPLVPPGSNFQVYVDTAPLAVGQSLRALVVTPSAGGHVLLTIENERVQYAKALELSGRARFIEVPLTAEMAPNAWAQVYRFEQAQPYTQQLPIRVKGSAVELPVRASFARSVAEPGSSVALSIEPGALAGRPGEYETAVTVVDEALLAIEPMRDDFVSFFGRKPRRLLVQGSSTMNQKSYRMPMKQTSQPTAAPERLADDKRDAVGNKMLKDVGAASGAMAPAAPSAEAEAAAPMAKKAKEERKVGRDEDDSRGNSMKPGGAEGPTVRSNFSSSSGWVPALLSRGAATTTVKLSDSLTTWRAVAFVVTPGPQLGQGAATIRSEKPLMVRLQAPRFFTEKDEVTLSAVVSSRLPKAADIEVNVSAPGFKALAPSSQRLTVAPGEDRRVDVRFKVVEPGEHPIRATASGAGKGDAMEWTLSTVVHGSAQRASFAGQLVNVARTELWLPQQRKAQLTRMELTLSPSLLAVMFDALPYLAQYPYGCVEQTLSRFVPASIAARAVKDLGLPAARVPPDLDQMVQAGLKRLYDFQHSDGGWGWWQTDATNRWMSAYALYGLSLGAKAGLTVDEGVLARGRSYLTQALGAAQNEPETHAFITFALQETGGAPRSALDFAFKSRTHLSPRGRALVALALLKAQDPRARIAVENLDDVVKAATSRPDAAAGAANDVWSTSAAIEATAYTLMAMARYDMKSPNLKPLTDFLVLRRNGGKWRTTRDTAFAIYALTELALKEEATRQTGTLVVLVNGKEVKRVRYQNGGLDLTAPVVLLDGAFKPGVNAVEVRRDGAGTGYYALTFDVYNQDDFIKGVGGDVTVKRTYTLLGKPSTERTQAPTEYGMPIESGTRVRVDLEVKANKPVEFVMVEDLKPAGLEAVLQKSGPEVCNYQCAHAELRTDRVALFLQAIPVGVTKLSYELRAEVPGKFAALPARAEAMYAPELQATSDEMRFEVKDAPADGVVGR